mgnify:FL=1
MMKQWALALFTATSLLLTACGTPAAENTNAVGAYASITDDNGRTVSFDKKPERIVVTSASFLEPLYAVGGEVIGRPDSKSKIPDAAKNVTSIGRVYQIDAEKVLSLTPDLVILNKGMNEKLVETLAANNVNTLVLDMKTYDDVKREIGIFATLTGEKEKGEQLTSKMDADIAAVRASIPSDKKRIAIIHSTGQGLSVQLDGSIAGSIANMLGWENTASGMTALDKNPDAAPYSMETLVAQNPDIIFVTSMGEEAEIRASMEAMFAESPAWQSVAAIRDGRVYYLPQEMFLFSPGIEYPEAVKYMARLVYP